MTTLTDGFKKVLMFKNSFAFDIEIYKNLFTLVAFNIETKKYLKFVLHDIQNDIPKLLKWLQTKPTLIGYNNIDFDAQILEYIIDKRGKISAEQIYQFVQNMFDSTKEDKFATPYKEWNFRLLQIDLMKMNHYGIYGAHPTSLKWLEFTMRWKKMRDLPIAHTETVSKSNINKVLTYNKNDVDVTYQFFLRCEGMIELRKQMSHKYNERRILSMSDASMASYIFKTILKKHVEPSKLKKGGTKRKIVNVAECILPYIQFDSPEFQSVLEFYQNTIIDVENKGLKGAIEHKAMFDNMEFSYGTGGIHAAYESGVYTPTEDETILSIDWKSYYSNISIANNFYPEHIGLIFCEVYNGVYKQRLKYEKGTAANYAMKIILNATYGKSNSKYSYLRDEKYTLQITINGQLIMSMLAEKLSKLGRILLVNTDGLEIIVKKSDLNKIKIICQKFENLTKMTLEHDAYSKVVIRDVNSYSAQFTNGTMKRKGFFEIYEDITTEPHTYYKNPSASIIPLALNEYFYNDTSVEETIEQCNDIHEYLIAIKGKKPFEYWMIKAEQGGLINIKKHNERAIRYYISSNGSNIFKHYNDGRKNNIQAVNKGQFISMAMDVTDERIFGDYEKGVKKGQTIDTYSDLNRNYYINECNKIIAGILN